MTASPQQNSTWIKQAAEQLGFDRCGITAAGPIPRGSYLMEWLDSGYAGTMGYLHRHTPSRLDVRSWLPWAQSVIVVALSYHQDEPRAGRDSTANDACPSRDNRQGHDNTMAKKLFQYLEEPRASAHAALDMASNETVSKQNDRDSADGGDRLRGRVAMYAWGEDYHAVLREKLEQLVRVMGEQIDIPFQARICVDTSAIVERELAAAAGVGWIGKNTLVLTPQLGSFFFLGEIITDLPLAPDRPETDHCGTCTRCLDACPTGAFPTPYTMDARRCISYLTIEHRGAIDDTLADKMGDWVFGCDICQTVCPFNHHSAKTAEPRFTGSANTATPVLEEIISWSDADYRDAVKGRAAGRAKPFMWRRNAQIARRNQLR